MPQRRVLIVDDALFMRNTLRDIFTGAGFAVAGEADDGVQAVNLFRELKEPAGAALAQVETADGPVKLIDPEQLQRAIDNLVEA